MCFRKPVLRALLVSWVLAFAGELQAQIPDINSLIQRGIEKKMAAKAAAEKAALVSTPAKRRALIIVTENYSPESKLSSLPGVTADGVAIQKALIKGGFEEKNVRLMRCDATNAADRPTKLNIDLAVRELSNSGEKGGLALVVFDGHGAMVGGSTYLCPMDTPENATTDPVVAQSRLVKYDDIENALSRSEASQKLLVIDACQTADDKLAANPVEFKPTTRDQVAVIRSCQSGTPAWHSSQWPSGESHSLFAAALIRALEGDADLAYGNNDGRVTVYELFHCVRVLTERFAEDRGHQQIPEFLYSSSPFELVTLSVVLPKPAFASGDAALDKSATADLLAMRGLIIERKAEDDWRKHFRKEVRDGKQIKEESFRDHYNQLWYAMGEYLTPAVELAPNCRIARLARAASHRSAGDYAAALDELGRCDDPEPLRLFATGNLASVEQLYQTNAWGNPEFLNLTDNEIKKLLGRLELRAEPKTDSKVVAEIYSSNQLTITAVRNVETIRGEEQWLQVTHVDTAKLKQAGWIPQSQVHWFPEAAELYIPGSPLYQGGVPAIIKAQQLASAETEKSQKLLKAIQDLEKARRGLAIAIQFGAPVGTAEAILATVQNALQMGYLASRQKYVNLYADYQIEVQRSAWLNEERKRLMRKQNLEALKDNPVATNASPWLDAKALR